MHMAMLSLSNSEGRAARGGYRSATLYLPTLPLFIYLYLLPLSTARLKSALGAELAAVMAVSVDLTSRHVAHPHKKLEHV